MAETWLRSNQRALGAGSLVGFLIASLAALAGSWAWKTRTLTSGSWLLFLVAALLFASAAAMAHAVRSPRIAFAGEEVLVYLRGWRPLRLPLDVVEAFFLGQGPSHLASAHLKDAETVNLVVRIAERAEGYHRRTVWPSLGHWCDGYITIRGAWCEPLDAETVTRINHQLMAAKRLSGQV